MTTGSHSDGSPRTREWWGRDGTECLEETRFLQAAEKWQEKTDMQV